MATFYCPVCHIRVDISEPEKEAPKKPSANPNRWKAMILFLFIIGAIIAIIGIELFKSDSSAPYKYHIAKKPKSTVMKVQERKYQNKSTYHNNDDGIIYLDELK